VLWLMLRLRAVELRLLTGLPTLILEPELLLLLLDTCALPEKDLREDRDHVGPEDDCFGVWRCVLTYKGELRRLSPGDRPSEPITSCKNMADDLRCPDFSDEEFSLPLSLLSTLSMLLPSAPAEVLGCAGVIASINSKGELAVDLGDDDLGESPSPSKKLSIRFKLSLG